MESLVQDSSAPPPSARLQHNRRSGTHGCALLLRGGDVCHILGGHDGRYTLLPRAAETPFSPTTQLNARLQKLCG